MDIWHRLAIALALGLLIGVERGWHERQEGEGRRIAGVRTFGLIGLLGGIWAMLAQEIGPMLLGFAFLGFVAVMLTAHVMEVSEDHDYGITTVVAALVTFALGATAVHGEPAIASAAAVVMATLLGMKPLLHGWVGSLEQRELYATLKLLLISVVALPVLPNRGYGPWDALNPYEIWWLVVLIAGISFVGYFAIKIAGARIGLFLTGIFGGLASSTALTLDFARLGRSNGALHGILAGGVVVAATTMFPRVMLEVSVVNAKLLPLVQTPLIAMTVLGYATVLWFWFREGRSRQPREVGLHNPFELIPALKFAGLLVAVMLLSKLFQQWFGDAGVYLVAAVSGLSDVDAITLSLARLAKEGLAPEVAARGIIIASVVNTLVKAGLVAAICGGGMALRVVLSLGATVAAGGAALWFTL